MLEHIKETGLDSFGEIPVCFVFGMILVIKFLVIICLLHYFHFVRLLPNLSQNYH